MGAGVIRASYYNSPRNVMDAKHLQETATQDLLQAMTAMAEVTYTHGDSPKDIPDNISIRNSVFTPLWILDGVQMTEPPDITVMESVNDRRSKRDNFSAGYYKKKEQRLSGFFRKAAAIIKYV
jgi:hypothetical protein